MGASASRKGWPGSRANWHGRNRCLSDPRPNVA
jgi:hypothetical protein